MKNLHPWLQRLQERMRGLQQKLRTARKQRLRQKVLAQGEIERLDRIRNPWKYLGK